jgi:hypothetical protein
MNNELEIWLILSELSEVTNFSEVTDFFLKFLRWQIKDFDSEEVKFRILVSEVTELDPKMT